MLSPLKVLKLKIFLFILDYGMEKAMMQVTTWVVKHYIA
jgi:hypothetical protein